MSELRLRNEIPERYTWNAPSVYPTPVDWDAAFEKVKSGIPTIRSFQGRLGEGSQVLIEWMAVVEEYGVEIGKLMVYANMGYTVDTTDQAAAARFGRVRGLIAEFSSAAAFADPELIEVGFEKLENWLKTEPRLAIMQHYIERLKERASHLRTAEIESLIGMLQDPFRGVALTHSTLADADMSFKPATGSDGQTFEIAQGTINALISHKDREVRRTAWENYADGYLAVKNAIANNLVTGIKQDVFMARVRRYGGSLEASLAPNRIPLEVFHNLIDVFKQNLPTWHRYWRLRKRALGVETFHAYDIKAPLSGESPVIPFEQAVDWITAGMQPMGEEYAETLRRGVLEQRWVDVYPNRGKRSGAFSSGSPKTYPFILMSYNDDIYSLSTLAHELGHSMHSFLAWKNQPYIYARYSLFVAEVASNFNQALVRQYLLENQTDRAFQIALLEEAMSNYHRYFFIMPTLARFELELHERAERGEALSAQAMIERMADLFAEGYGSEVEQDRPRNGITWAQFPNHLYANFYVYQYATGIAGANALANGVLQGKPGAVEDYLEFLKAGGSLYPLDALARAGVNLAEPAPVEAAFALLAEYVTRLENLV